VTWMVWRRELSEPTAPDGGAEMPRLDRFGVEGVVAAAVLLTLFSTRLQ
jgi:hypothetical protein